MALRIITLAGQQVGLKTDAMRWRSLLGERYLGTDGKPSFKGLRKGRYSLEGLVVAVDADTVCDWVKLTVDGDGFTAAAGTGALPSGGVKDILQATSGSFAVGVDAINWNAPGVVLAAQELDGTGSINGVPVSAIVEADGRTVQETTHADAATTVDHIGSADAVNAVNGDLVFTGRHNAQLIFAVPAMMNWTKGSAGYTVKATVQEWASIKSKLVGIIASASGRTGFFTSANSVGGGLSIASATDGFTMVTTNGDPFGEMPVNTSAVVFYKA